MGSQKSGLFDAGKDHFFILHPSRSQDETFKMLGSVLDTALSMVPCIEDLFRKIRPKARALLKISSHFYLPSIIYIIVLFEQKSTYFLKIPLIFYN